jgi:hypothetical protein
LYRRSGVTSEHRCTYADTLLREGDRARGGTLLDERADIHIAAAQEGLEHPREQLAALESALTLRLTLSPATHSKVAEALAMLGVACIAGKKHHTRLIEMRDALAAFRGEMYSITQSKKNRIDGACK